MKYIRTENGIFDQINEGLILASNPPKYELTKNGKHIGYAFCKDCQLGDTIEELCDEFVLVGERIAPKHSFLTFEQAKFNFKSLINQTYVDFAIYGAIWTDKGLIYVAKMNEKGELELL